MQAALRVRRDEQKNRLEFLRLFLPAYFFSSVSPFSYFTLRFTQLAIRMYKKYVRAKRNSRVRRAADNRRNARVTSTCTLRSGTGILWDNCESIGFDASAQRVIETRQLFSRHRLHFSNTLTGLDRSH